MKLESAMQMQGRVHLRLWDPDGKLKTERTVENLVVEDGREHTADQLAKVPAQTAMGWMAIGSDPSPPPPDAADTDLQGSGGEQARVALDGAHPIATSFAVDYKAVFGPGVGTDTDISEAIIVNNGVAGPASGVILARTTFTPIDKQVGDTLTIDWTVTLAGP